MRYKALLLFLIVLSIILSCDTTASNNNDDVKQRSDINITGCSISGTDAAGEYVDIIISYDIYYESEERRTRVYIEADFDGYIDCIHEEFVQDYAYDKYGRYKSVTRTIEDVYLPFNPSDSNKDYSNLYSISLSVWDLYYNSVNSGSGDSYNF